jgi:glycosyltransferase involved in cell wall biosynthesis
MNIVHTPVRILPFIGGVENYVYYLSKELVNLDHKVTIICANVPHTQETEYYSDGIKIEKLNHIGRIAGTHISPGFPKRIISKKEVDIIHTHLPSPWWADFSAYASKVNKKPLILTYHNDIIGKGIFNTVSNLYNSSLLKILLNQSSKIIITQKNYLNYSPHLKKYRDKITVIPCGVDTDQFKPNKETPKKENQLFFLSVLNKSHQYKGLDVLIRAMKTVKQQIPEAKLIVGGAGDLLEHYRELARQEKVDDIIVFRGFISDKEKEQHYRESSVFILPSTSSTQEGFGIVNMEALSSGTPVITSNITGLAEDVIEWRCGKVVEPQNTEELAREIIMLLGDPKLREFGENGRRLIEEKYSWSNIAKQVERLYLSVLEDGYT